MIPWVCSLGLVAGLLTVISIEALRRYGRVESNTAMGGVLIAFAIGVILIRWVTRIMLILIPTVCCTANWNFWSGSTLQLVSRRWSSPMCPRPAFLDLVVADHGRCRLLRGDLTSELRLVSFDPGLARTLGFSSSAINMVLMLLVSVATVASFEAVGSVLVIAALLVPASTARLFRIVSRVRFWSVSWSP